MSKKIRISTSGTARNCKNCYVGINGQAHKVTKGYIGINGVAHQFWPSGYTWNYYNIECMLTWDRPGTGTSMYFTSALDNYIYATVESVSLNDDGSYYYQLDTFRPTSSTDYPSGFYPIKLVDIRNNVWEFRDPNETDDVGIFYITFSRPNTFWRYNSQIEERTGSMIGQVQSDDISAYPSNGRSGKYWYILQQ